MATLTRYWRSDADAAGDGTTNTASSGDNTHAYITLVALEAAEQADLTIAGDVLHAICTETGGETGIVAWDGWTTGIPDYILVECQGDAAFLGVSKDRSGAGYLHDKVGTSAFQIKEEYFRCDGLEVQNTGNQTVSIFISSPGASDLRFDNMGILSSSTSGAGGYSFQNHSALNITVTNCLIVTAGSSPATTDLCTSAVLDHCGMWGGSTTGNSCLFAQAETTVTNCWAANADGDDFRDLTVAPTGSHNASEDASAAVDYTNTVINYTPTDEFTSPSSTFATFDFTLKKGVLNGAGTGSLTTDITGATRTGTPDIGPFNYLAPKPIYRRRHVGFQYG